MNLKVEALCHTKEMDDLVPISSVAFPNNVSEMVGGMLKPGEPIAYENSYIWEIETEEEAVECLKEIQECIVASAFPFFASITDRQKLIGFMYPSMHGGNYLPVIEKVLAWKKPDKSN
ncbi:hypothetical protein ISG33_11175 [Glaciecola sp. MH2013]|uniref:hypothetical protein n=1 Tax=Glaciecola sp. MH2013 TaxID=2785524 RepID=UPI00189E2486|nr:hypothetical protein [Glaciecola sp. MH2013]MBF7073961.1 hypothetical protein [Glaciecola sp. MH2013]